MQAGKTVAKEKHFNGHLLGLDIGTVSLHIALVDGRGRVLQTEEGFHHGDLAGTLQMVIGRFDLPDINAVACTSGTPSMVAADARYDDRICIMETVRRFHGQAGAILTAGGEQFSLVNFDETGNYLGCKTNTSCAAGTGSFLDQQAQRLNLPGSETLAALALKNRGPLPQIASRCAVFAKTDLIHAQQEGFPLEAICDGLCAGLARNIADALFAGRRPREPVMLVGGVSRNRAVVKHIETLLGIKLTVDPLAPFYGAIGAALNALADGVMRDRGKPIRTAEDLVLPETEEKAYFHPPLELALSDYPDFSSLERYEETLGAAEDRTPVEVDLYEQLPATGECAVFLGIDVGSTSTKTVLVSPAGAVLAGFYTRTAGQPVAATQKIIAALESLALRKSLTWSILGAGTTGSGRKFIGKIIDADLIVDEITAHARAAVELRPDADTIIEIGGQDSKFTTLKNATVTFSVMNHVCAAGTGSFIEEQAQRLGCALTDYASRAENRRAPITSDRCTVFMERDINHHLSAGYGVDEALAAALHAIVENYLSKVAVEASVGKTILFQGATAKNRALVAAFEQRLGRPIHVSKFCHLTGAWGVALMMADAKLAQSRFRGFGLHRARIPIASEVCRLCNNRCKITVADVAGARVAFGFLCGRDYEGDRFVNNNRSGFDLLRERRRVFAAPQRREPADGPIVGLPAALHLADELPVWQGFFARLGVKTVTSEGYRSGGIREGKRLSQAEFCAPIAALHGHVRWLLSRCDYVFVPFSLERKNGEKEVRRQYCYYTQYAPALIRAAVGQEDAKRILAPLVHYLYPQFNAKAQLYRMLASIRPGVGFLEVVGAYDKSVAAYNAARARWRRLYRETVAKDEGINVVLLGRPYTVFSEEMNKGIPGIVGALGIKAFYQDMLDVDKQSASAVAPLLKEIHWRYAAIILAAAAVVARTRGAYPVFLTSFKCSPDSFIINYFRKIMEADAKPYLILQLDEHDSRVGYETRIEAAIRTFRNHAAAISCPAPPAEPVRGGTALDAVRSLAHSALEGLRNTLPLERNAKPCTAILTPSSAEPLKGKTLILPNWDAITSRLVTANLRAAGIDARSLPETDEKIRKSLRLNTGQCIPIHIIAQEFIDYVEEQGLDPARCALWMARGTIACNIRLYPYHIKTILETYGRGMEKASVYTGNLSMADISLRLPLGNYLAYMFGGLVRRLGCRIRPYERVKGRTDQAIRTSVCLLEDAFLGRCSREDAVKEVVSLFATIACEPDGRAQRPKVAIFGDLYARDNDTINQNLIRFIEEQGGEVITTPYTTYAKMIAGPYMRKWLIEGHYLSVLSSGAILAAAAPLEKVYYRYFQQILREPEPDFNENPEEILAPYGLRIEHTGESMDNILKVHYIKKYHPDVALFVQTSPAFCCPSLVTEAMAGKIEAVTGVPVVSITYDGTGGFRNDAIIPYLKCLRRTAQDPLRCAAL
jgi:predicted CoA-substrate-specific enzyme activase